MLPSRREYMESKLIRKGHSHRAVENMKPWRLISCYSAVSKSANIKESKDVSFYEKRAVWDSKTGSYVYR